MKGRTARVARNVGHLCSCVELLEDRALLSVQLSMSAARAGVLAGSRDIADLIPAASASKLGRAAIADTTHRGRGDASRSNIDANVAIRESQPPDDTDPDDPRAPSVIPDNSTYFAIILEEQDVDEGPGLDAEDSASPIDWSTNDPRGDGSPTSDVTGPVIKPPAGMSRVPPASVSRGRWAWLWTVAVLHPGRSFRGPEAAAEDAAESQARPWDRRNVSIMAPHENGAGAHDAGSSGQADLLMGGAGPENWERLDRDLRQFLARRFGGDPATTEIDTEGPNLTSWLTLLTAMLAARTLTRRGSRFRRLVSWTEPAGHEPDPQPGWPGPWPLGPP